MKDASNQLERALNAVRKMAKENETKVSDQKTAIVVVGVDSRECNGKADTSFKLAGEVVIPSKEVAILVVTNDCQLKTATHAQIMK